MRCRRRRRRRRVDAERPVATRRPRGGRPSCATSPRLSSMPKHDPAARPSRTVRSQPGRRVACAPAALRGTSCSGAEPVEGGAQATRAASAGTTSGNSSCSRVESACECRTSPARGSVCSTSSGRAERSSTTRDQLSRSVRVPKARFTGVGDVTPARDGVGDHLGDGAHVGEVAALLAVAVHASGRPASAADTNAGTTAA